MASDCGYLRGIEAAAREMAYNWPASAISGAIDRIAERLAATHDPASCRECRVLAATGEYEAARSALQAFDRDDVDALCDLEERRRIGRLHAAKRRVRTAEKALLRAVREGRS